jgi:hypothetical protein
MPKKKAASLRLDANELAHRTVMAALGEGPRPYPPGEGPKNKAAVTRGKLGGSKGGKARAAKLTGKELAKIGKKGAKARWAKKA